MVWNCVPMASLQQPCVRLGKTQWQDRYISHFTFLLKNLHRQWSTLSIVYMTLSVNITQRKLSAFLIFYVLVRIYAVVANQKKKKKTATVVGSSHTFIIRFLGFSIIFSSFLFPPSYRLQFILTNVHGQLSYSKRWQAGRQSHLSS